MIWWQQRFGSNLPTNSPTEMIVAKNDRPRNWGALGFVACSKCRGPKPVPGRVEGHPGWGFGPIFSQHFWASLSPIKLVCCSWNKRVKDPPHFGVMVHCRLWCIALSTVFEHLERWSSALWGSSTIESVCCISMKSVRVHDSHFFCDFAISNCQLLGGFVPSPICWRWFCNHF